MIPKTGMIAAPGRRLGCGRSTRIALSLCVAAAFSSGMPSLAQESASDFNTAGVEHYNAGRWADAVASFEQAFELSPENSTVSRNLCNAYQSLADALAKEARLGDAIACLEAALNVDPQNASPYIQLAAYHLRLGQPAEAAFRLEDALTLGPDNLDAIELYGDACYQMNDLQTALDQWLAVQKKQPNRPGLQKKIEKATREASVESGFRQTNSRHFEINFAPETSPTDKRRVSTILEQAYRDIGRKFGNVFPDQPVVVLIHTANSFAEATAVGSHVGALYDGKIRAPIMDVNGNLLPDDELRRRLYHEYTHVVVRYLLEDRVPWWLNEGLAETFSREFGNSERSLFLSAMDEGRLLDMAQLEEAQLEKRSVTELQLAYVQAHAVTAFLWERFGQRYIQVLMENLANGAAYEDALRLTYRRDYATLMREVAAHLRE